MRLAEQTFFEETGGYLNMSHVLSGARLVLARGAGVTGRPLSDRRAACGRAHYLDDTTGRGGQLAQIVILEHPALDTYGVVFRLAGGEIPFAELEKIASCVSFD